MFLFDLAYELKTDIDEVMSWSRAKQVYWAAYLKIKPPDDPFWRTGLTCSVIANCHRDEKRKPKPYEPEDFIPGREKPKPIKNDKALIAAINALKAKGTK